MTWEKCPVCCAALNGDFSALFFLSGRSCSSHGGCFRYKLYKKQWSWEKGISFSLDEHSLLTFCLWRLVSKACSLAWTPQIHFIICGIYKSALGIIFFFLPEIKGTDGGWKTNEVGKQCKSTWEWSLHQTLWGLILFLTFQSHRFLSNCCFLPAIVAPISKNYEKHHLHVGAGLSRFITHSY